MYLTAIDFDEFLGMYKRLFVQCRSVVSNDMAMLMSPRRSPDLTSKIPSPTKRVSSARTTKSLRLFIFHTLLHLKINDHILGPSNSAVASALC